MNVNLGGGYGSVKLSLTHSNPRLMAPEIRFGLSETISTVKETCEKRFGTSTANMKLVLQDLNGNSIATMDDDSKLLGYYSPQDNYIIHVIDLDPNSFVNEFDDISQVEKYMMSDEEYDKRPDSVRKFKAMLAKAQGIEPKKPKDDAWMCVEAQNFVVGNRAQLKDQGHRGVIKYVGLIPEIAEGWWVGIQLDEPFGKNDGKAKGTKYFDCPPNYGIFVRPEKAEMGDFPELDLDDEI